MNAFKKNSSLGFLLILMLFMIPKLYGQDDFISYTEFKKIKINNLISLDDLHSANGNWQPMINAFGNSNGQSCTSSFVGTQCIFQYNGLKLNYNDYNGSFEMLFLEITNNNYQLHYNNNIIKVGDNIDILEPIFPDAYEKRQGVNFDGNTKYFVMLRVGEDSTLRIVFNFEIHTGEIISIQLEE